MLEALKKLRQNLPLVPDIGTAALSLMLPGLAGYTAYALAGTVVTALGIENELTAQEIGAADAVVFAVDIEVEGRERFAAGRRGMPSSP